jgi:hypothetical protein
MRFRGYTPATGQFISDDPLGLIGGDPNIRRYVHNNPTTRIDPSGLWDLHGFETHFPVDYNQNTGELSVSVPFLESLRISGNVNELAKEDPFGIEDPLADVVFKRPDTNFPPIRHRARIVPPKPEIERLFTQAKERAQARIPFIGSGDPNNLVGPAGFGTQNWIPPDQQLLPYTVQFENDPKKANAAAQDVTVTEQLDPNLDWSTFELGTIQFGATTIDVPPGLQSFATTVNTTNVDGTPLKVDITAALNQQTGLVTWTFLSLDPATGQPPTDPVAGFLPVDDSTGRGEAFVNYTVQPRANLTTGTQLNAQATVVFDTNAPLSTNTFTNTIDAGPPTSSVNPLPSVTNSTSFSVSWSGSDPGGPGIASFDIFVSADGGAFTPWLTGTTQTSAVYSGAFGHRYAFYSVATDPLGFRQPAPGGAQASTVLMEPPRPVSVVLLTRRFGKKHKKLVAEVLFSGGRPPLDIVSPFQKSAFQGILAALHDADGDGLFDSILFTARRGRKKFSRIVPV